MGIDPRESSPADILASNIRKIGSIIPGANDVSWVTSVPAAILSLMIVRGQLKKTGVYPCETLDREERKIFFDGIREWDLKVQKQVTEIA